MSYHICIVRILDPSFFYHTEWINTISEMTSPHLDLHVIETLYVKSKIFCFINNTKIKYVHTKDNRVSSFVILCWWSVDTLWPVLIVKVVKLFVRFDGEIEIKKLWLIKVGYTQQMSCHDTSRSTGNTL